MKKYLYSLLLLAASGSAFAQTNTDAVKIHILYKGNFDYNLKTTLNADQPIALAGWTYTLLETNAEELTLLRGKEQTATLAFEKGKDYYFRISYPEPSSFQGANVDELSANAFKLELYANRRINAEPKLAKIWIKQDFK